MELTTLLAIGLSPSLLVMLGGVILAFTRTLEGTASDDAAYSGHARSEV